MVSNQDKENWFTQVETPSSESESITKKMEKEPWIELTPVRDITETG